jgi:hypothetical protein
VARLTGHKVSFETVLSEGQGPAYRSNLRQTGQRQAFTPAVILVISLPDHRTREAAGHLGGQCDCSKKQNWQRETGFTHFQSPNSGFYYGATRNFAIIAPSPANRAKTHPTFVG